MSASWLANKIEQWPTAKLLPYARNARTHSPEQVAQIAASIVEFGFTNPILAGSDGIIVAGHGRLTAAQKLGQMCIRDSCYPGPTLTPPTLNASFAVGKTAAGGLPNEHAKTRIPNGCRTHDRCQAGRVCAETAPVPVSYTHLDVYKRQA